MNNFPDWSFKGIKSLDHIFKGTDFMPLHRLVGHHRVNKNRSLNINRLNLLSIIVNAIMVHLGKCTC